MERCVVVGLSYGGMIGFKMAELYPDLVESMVVSGSVEALTESLSSTRLKGLGQKRWSDFLLPTTAEGVKELFRVATHWLPPWIPNRIFKDYFEVCIGCTLTATFCNAPAFSFKGNLENCY